MQVDKAIAITRRRPIIWQAIIPLVLVAALVALSILASLIAPYGPLTAGDSLRPPSADHVWGTDQIGRDVFSRVLYGGRLTFGTAGLALLLVVIAGTAMGLVAGYADGIVDFVIVAFIDALLA